MTNSLRNRTLTELGNGTETQPHEFEKSADKLWQELYHDIDNGIYS